jgi:hypothetical protein
MDKKRSIAIIVFALEAVFSLLFLVVSAGVFAALMLMVRGSDDQAENVILAVLRGLFIGAVLLCIVSFAISISGVIKAVKKCPAQAILNSQATFIASYLLVLTIIGVFSLIANRPINPDAVVSLPLIRLGFIVVALVITIISMFLKKRQAKCILLISAILMCIVLTVGSSIAAISLYALIFCLLQLILPILYLIFKDDDPDAHLKSEKEREEAIEALIQLDQDLREGYISDQEYDAIRKQYIDKL